VTSPALPDAGSRSVIGVPGRQWGLAYVFNLYVELRKSPK
jgi:hypothetical protein